MSDFAPFQSPKLLVERSRFHLRNFEVKEGSYFDRKPYVMTQEDDSQRNSKFFKFKFTRPIPVELSVVAFDAINCIRSALDHAVFDAAVQVSGRPDPKATKFPFGNDAASAEKDLQRKHSEIPESLVPLLLSFEPFKNGRNALWELNDLRNQKIHRMLAPAAA